MSLPPMLTSTSRTFHTNEFAITVVHNIVCAVDQGKVVTLMLLDLNAAFDTVNHSTLVSIMHPRFTVSGQSLTMLQLCELCLSS